MEEKNKSIKTSKTKRLLERVITVDCGEAIIYIYLIANNNGGAVLMMAEIAVNDGKLVGDILNSLDIPDLVVKKNGEEYIIKLPEVFVPHREKLQTLLTIN